MTTRDASQEGHYTKGEGKDPFSDPRVPQQRYKFSLEELRVLRECNRESFYFRSLPMSAAGALAVHFAVKQGYLKGHPRFGSAFKILGVSVFGWFLGKVSYRKTCEEKLLKLPNSQFAEMLRKRAGGYSEMLTTEIPGTTEINIPSSESKNSANFDSRRTLSVDKYKQNPGFDDSQRPNLDNTDLLQRKDNFESQDLPEATSITSYEELRRRNREEYEQRTPGSRLPTSGPIPQPPLPSFSNEPLTDRARSRKTGAGVAKNQYGDVWEE